MGAWVLSGFQHGRTFSSSRNACCWFDAIFEPSSRGAAIG